MNDECLLDLKIVLNILRGEVYLCGVEAKRIKVYELTPWEFLSFARQDLEESSERGRINALSNAKRAIECRVDEVITLSHLKGIASRLKWGLPYKLLVLKSLGMPAPEVLKGYISSKRNLLEHEYLRLNNPEETKYLADITELFLSATDKYVEEGYISSVEITLRNEGQWEVENTSTKKRIVYEDVYQLSFDLDSETLTMTKNQFECDCELLIKTAEINERKKSIGEPSSSTIKIRDCKETDIAELIKLIKGKRTW